MPDIRVDPKELAKAARELEAAAERLRELAAEALEAGDSAPSYDGQFGPQVQQLGLEAHAALSSQAQRLALHSEELVSLSAAFEEADRETAAGFNVLWDWFARWWERAADTLPAWLAAWLSRGGGGRPSPVASDAEDLPRPGATSVAPIAATPTSTPEVIYTPMPPELPPPTPTGTPSAEEMQAQRAAQLEAAHARWLEAFIGELEDCTTAPDREGCIIQVARTIYDHHGLPLEALAAAKQDNPLPEDSLEFSLLTQSAIGTGIEPENAKFIEDLGMRSQHIQNFEPAYFEALQAAHPGVYAAARRWAEMGSEEREVWDKIFIEELVEWPFGEMMRGFNLARGSE